LEYEQSYCNNNQDVLRVRQQRYCVSPTYKGKKGSITRKKKERNEKLLNFVSRQFGGTITVRTIMNDEISTKLREELGNMTVREYAECEGTVYLLWNSGQQSGKRYD